jgi:hypothetical protein
MSKALIVLLFAFVACNNSSDASKQNPGDSSTVATPSRWTAQDENEFIDDCIAGAKNRFSEDTAYIYCRCALRKVKEHFPTRDSADVVLQDSVRAAEFTKECR